MDSPLLVTKLHTPPLRSGLVRRTRLTTQLDESRQRNQRFVLVSAPAGFGKTTLVIDWLAHTDAQVVWLSLDEQDDGIERFLLLLIAALQQVSENIGLVVHQELRLPQPPPLANLMTSLVNDIAAVADDLILVLDDLHLITDPGIYQALEFLVDHLPHNTMILIITREDPPLPLARLRVGDQLLEIREPALRFTPDETGLFFENTIKLALPDEAITTLCSQTEGWAAGIQLAALTLKSAQIDTKSFLAGFSGRDRYVADYLMTEVLQHLSAELQDFLKQTSILNRLNASLCDALTGRVDSQTILEQLEASNLFLIPLDHQRVWYRYNRLFADFLQGRLSPAERRDLHLKAMAWYEASGYLDLAFHHALAAADYNHVERLMLQTAETILHDGGITTLANRLDMLPTERLRASAPLAIYKGLTSVLTGQIDVAEEYARIAQAHKQSMQASSDIAGNFALLRAFIALTLRDDQAGIAFVTEAIQTLTQPNWRIMALWLASEAHERTGSIQGSITALTEARQIGYARPPQLFIVIIDAFLASALNEHGQLQEAIAICEQAIKRYVSRTGEPLPIAAIVYGRMAILMIEANRLDEARRYQAQLDQLAHQLFIDDLYDLSQGILVRILSASGEINAALAILRALQPDVSTDTLSDKGWLIAEEMSLQLKQGNMAYVERWADKTDWFSNDALHYLHWEEYLVYGHYLLRSGDVEAADTWLARLEDFTGQNALYRRQNVVHILRALTAAQAGDSGNARKHLTAAVKSAAPEGYIQMFLEYGDSLLDLLPRVRVHAPAFVDSILNAAHRSKNTLTQSLVDPLSEREIEVLRLITIGLSNPEIAGRLFITVGTVKRHINHIYGKLEIRTRAQAVIKAQELNLL